MVVLNLSQQTDSSDLLGGFRPVPAGKQILKLLTVFQDLFNSTFTKGKNEAFLARILKFAQKEKWQNLIQAFHSALSKVAELEAQQKQHVEPELSPEDEEFEKTLEKAHRLVQDSNRIITTGEVWRALNSDEDQRHKQDIDALLKAAEENQPVSTSTHSEPVTSTLVAPIEDIKAHLKAETSVPMTTAKKGLDWDDDEIFDELLAAVPAGKTATDVHTPFTTPTATEQPTLRIVEDLPATAAAASAAVVPGVSNAVPHAPSVRNALDTDFDDLDDFLV